MRKIKILLGMALFAFLVTISVSNNAIATDITIDKLEISFPASAGATVPTNAEITAYANNVIQENAVNDIYDILDLSTYSVFTGSVFEKHLYEFAVVINPESGYDIVCTDDGKFQGTLIFNGKTVSDNYSLASCNSSSITLMQFLDLRDYYDITKLNFSIPYPTSTSVAGDLNATMSNGPEGLDYTGSWFKYNGEHCDFSGDLTEAYACIAENSEDMDDDEGFTVGEQYTYVLDFSHPNYAFDSLSWDSKVASSFTALSQGANFNGTSTSTGFVAGMRLFYMTFFNIPSLKDHFTITYDTLGLGTAPDTQTVAPNAVLTQPADPTAEGYVFEGWYYDEDYTRPVDFSMPITNDLTLYVKWTRISVPDAGEFTNIDTSSVAGSVFSVFGGVLAVAFIAVTIRCRSGRK